jgi:hypothetical protein
MVRILMALWAVLLTPLLCCSEGLGKQLVAQGMSLCASPQAVVVTDPDLDDCCAPRHTAGHGSDQMPAHGQQDKDCHCAMKSAGDNIPLDLRLPVNLHPVCLGGVILNHFILESLPGSPVLRSQDAFRPHASATLLELGCMLTT